MVGPWSKPMVDYGHYVHGWLWCPFTNAQSTMVGPWSKLMVEPRSTMVDHMIVQPWVFRWGMTICVQDRKWFLWKSDFEKSALKVTYSYSFDLTGCRKCRIFCGKCLKMIQKLHALDRKHIKACKKQKCQNQQMSHFSPLYQLQLPVSRNRPVRLVPCFVGVHHSTCSFICT